MHNRIKRLEELVSGAAAMVQRLQEENELLQGQVRLLGAARGKAGANTAAVRELAGFKDKVRRRLERICAKIEKINDLQPGLFGEHDEE
ncbi:MAG: hypothetical protein A2234_07190 [Elusimicrobia bacterium RIFOXYA2_FULL_58_8]|nr:MAG: hypothetical protein A2234_07190 [Elusimicrobia bacterium RIFOXYA2_FULL_58_8]OGS12667.1 MAG: hypothetical protein A2285_07730 [Elusimicrobia bacterium RIFOXYA12_FULL_57_11]